MQKWSETLVHWFLIFIFPSIEFQSTLSVRGSPKGTPKLPRKDSVKSQRSWLGILRNRDESKHLVDSLSDSGDDADNEDANNKRFPHGSRRNSTTANNYR